MSLYDSNDYKAIFMEAIRSRPNGGRGILRAMSRSLKIHTSRLSQVLSGNHHFTPEHAHQVAQFLGLSEREIEYVLLLVERDRAGTSALAQLYERMIARIRKESARISSHVPRDEAQVLSPEEQSIFYSSWLYPAISLLCDIPEYRKPEAIAKKLNIPHETVLKALEFLLQTGLVRRMNQEYVMGTASTHLGADSLLITSHHTHWRTRAIQTHPRLRDEELAYSGPMVLSRSDFKKARKLLLKVIQEITHMAIPSRSEQLVCLGIDWFEI